jgi:uncharacterized protein YjbJ (UPF0337 family)
MNWERIKGKWDELKGSAKARWGELTDDDLREIEGKREALTGKLEQRHGMAKEQAERGIDEWAARQR